MAEWTSDDVASRLIDAARTARRLPSVRVQGYFNVWPAFVRTAYERMACEDVPVPRFPPTPVDVQQMLEVMQWVQWLEVELLSLELSELQDAGFALELTGFDDAEIQSLLAKAGDDGSGDTEDAADELPVVRRRSGAAAGYRGAGRCIAPLPISESNCARSRH